VSSQSYICKVAIRDTLVSARFACQLRVKCETAEGPIFEPDYTWSWIMVRIVCEGRKSRGAEVGRAASDEGILWEARRVPVVIERAVACKANDLNDLATPMG
jgi:hypothetical protein